MNTVATIEEKLKIVYLCLTTGLPYFVSYGFTMEYDDTEYNKAHESLNEKGARGELTDTICVEDIQTEMLRLGYSLKFIDHEDEDEAETLLNLALIEANWDNVRIKDLADMDEETGNWDAETADCIMQCLLFGEITYG